MNEITSPTMLNSEQIRTLLQSWNLSPKAIAVLKKEPEIVEALAEARSLPPFPSDYMPQEYELRFEDATYIMLKRGQSPDIQDCSPNYSPAFVEYCFDDQTALFTVDGEIIVDRTQNLSVSAIIASFD